jgi:hypothetical protein
MRIHAPLAVLRQQYGPAGHDQEGRVVAKSSSPIWLQYLSPHLQQTATLVLSRLKVWLKCDILSTLAEHMRWWLKEPVNIVPRHCHHRRRRRHHCRWGHRRCRHPWTTAPAP